MHALSVRLSSKRLYIADLAARLEGMEDGRIPMNALAYRLYARRMKAAMAGYPPGLLAAQLGRGYPSVLHAIEQRQFELDGFMSGHRGRKAFVLARALLRHLDRHRRGATP
jgi:hypothetical protein